MVLSRVVGAGVGEVVGVPVVFGEREGRSRKEQEQESCHVST